MLSNIFRYAATAMLGVAATSLLAQTPAPVTPPLAGVHYRYWTKHFTQWVGPELPYSIISLDVDDRSKQPIYDAQLIDKSGASAVHYTNSAEELAIDQHSGMTAYQVPMQFDGPADPTQGAQYMLRFNTEKGVPVVWQFILSTDPTEMGTGVTPISAGPVQILAYRELGALAGQGTALQVGGVTSAAEVWNEYAHPPYFVPYHGALAVGVHVLVFAPGATTWTKGAQVLTDPAGTSLSLTKDGDDLPISNTALKISGAYTLSGTNGISRVSFGPVNAKRDHTVSLVFTPALTPGGESSFEIVAGKKSKFASGKVKAVAAPDGTISETWTIESPDPLKGKEITATAAVKP